MSVYVNVKKNGSFTVSSGKLSLLNCYPGIDGEVVKPIDISVVEEQGKSKITYNLLEGNIELTISQVQENISIASKISGFSTAIHWFNPIFEAKIEGLLGAFRQGVGFGGPTGYLFKDELIEKNYIESYGLSSLGGSHEFLFIYADDYSRFNNKYDVLVIKRQKNSVRFSAGFAIEGIQEQDIELPALNIFGHTDLEKGLERTASKIAEKMGSRTEKAPAYYWCSWYYKFHNMSHSILTEYLDNFSKMKEQVPFKYIQIDAGYFPAAGDWLIPNSRFPRGMKATFDEIKEKGYKPGIWIGPYMVGNKSILYKEHPDWILIDINDKPITPWKLYHEQKIWGFEDEEYYVLDTSHPEALEYLRKVFRTLKEWGAELFKTDFMLWGFQDSTELKRHTPGKTSVEYFRELLSVIREEIGEETYWLGCIAPFMPFIGYCDGMRVAGDSGAQWGEWGDWGTPNMLREVTGDNYMNYIYWQNDPDSSIIRDFHTELTDIEVKALTLFQAVSGGIVTTSDPIHELSPDRLKLLEFIEAKYPVKPSIPTLTKATKVKLMLHKLSEGRMLLYILNPTTESMTESYNLKDITGENNAYIRDWETGEYTEQKVQDFLVRIPSHGCKLYFMSQNMPLKDDIKNLWIW